MYPIPVSIMLVVALCIFAFSMQRRLQILAMMKGSDRFDKMGERILSLLKFGVAQHRLIFKKDFMPGLLHAFIFWGFCTVGLQTILSFIMGFNVEFVTWFMNTPFGNVYRLVKDCVELLVVTGVLYFLVRRIFTKPSRITLSWEGVLILCFIFTLMVTDFINDGVHYIHHGFPSSPLWGPVGIAFGHAMQSMNLSDSALAWIGGISYFLHIAIVLTFLNFLPYGKHFHVITSLPNVFLRNLKPYGALRTI
ncbi:MAG: (Fe-S)-binding protein, partial [Deltaproteobacteria bacterium]|nr:(Fe-S)-binding protein [Deltaproteobacteria bacterium]